MLIYFWMWEYPVYLQTNLNYYQSPAVHGDWGWDSSLLNAKDKSSLSKCVETWVQSLEAMVDPQISLRIFKKKIKIHRINLNDPWINWTWLAEFQKNHQAQNFIWLASRTSAASAGPWLLEVKFEVWWMVSFPSFLYGKSNNHGNQTFNHNEFNH